MLQLKIELLFLMAIYATKFVDCRTHCNNFFLQVFPELGCNLTQLTFSEPIVSLYKYKKLLADSKIMIMKAQLTVGSIKGKGEKQISICGFPSMTSSDLSLETFLEGVLKFNTKSVLQSERRVKGVKLKFPDIKTFEKSNDLLSNLYKHSGYFMILNADVIEGPGKPIPEPVDPDRFLSEISTRYPGSVVSVGWTTDPYGGAFTQKHHIEPMIQAIKRHKIEQVLTFPVRAGNAANSMKVLQGLLNTFPNSTLSIWSTTGDTVNINNLRKLITTVGWDLCNFDLANDLRKKLFNGWKIKGPVKVAHHK